MGKGDKSVQARAPRTPTRRKATCTKCGATEPKPLITAVCELRTMTGFKPPCVNNVRVFNERSNEASRLRVGVRKVRRQNRSR